MDKAFVILGEASESDEDEKVMLSVVRGKAKSSTTNKGVIVAGEASESDSESEDTFREAFFARNGAVENRIEDESQQAAAQYDTLLHKKLRECNESLHNNITFQSRQSLTNAVRSFNTTNQQLLTTQVLIQDAASSFAKAFDNLDKLNDSLNHVLATPYIPQINIL